MVDATRTARGAIGAIRRNTLIGWAFVEGEPPVTVDIALNGEPLASVVANTMRPEFPARGIHPTGECGFEVPIPDGVKLKDGDILECTVENALDGWRRNPAVVRVDEDGRYTLEPAPPPESANQDVLPAFPIIPHRPRLRVVKDTMRALFLREVRNRYGVSRAGYFWAVFQPILFVIALQAARFSFRGKGGTDLYGVNGFYFFQLGVIPWFMFMHGYHQAMGSMRQFRGLYTYRQIQPIDMILVKCAIEFLMMTVTFMFFLVVFQAIGWPVSFVNPAAFVAMLAVLYIFTVSLGLIADIAVTRNEDMRRVFQLADRPLFLMSGVFFTLEAMPHSLHPYLMWNPLLHALELGRAAMLVNYATPCSWTYLVACTVVTMMFALGLYRRHLYLLTS